MYFPSAGPVSIGAYCFEGLEDLRILSLLSLAPPLFPTALVLGVVECVGALLDCAGTRVRSPTEFERRLRNLRV